MSHALAGQRHVGSLPKGRGEHSTVVEAGAKDPPTHVRKSSTVPVGRNVRYGIPEARTSQPSTEKHLGAGVSVVSGIGPAPAAGTSGVRYGWPGFWPSARPLARVTAGKRVTPPLPILAVERRLRQAFHDFGAAGSGHDHLCVGNGQSVGNGSINAAVALSSELRWPLYHRHRQAASSL